MSIFSHGMREILLLSHLLRPHKHPDMHVLPLTHWPTYFSTPNEGLQFNVVVFFFVFFLCQSPPYLLGRQSESERVLNMGTLLLSALDLQWDEIYTFREFFFTFYKFN